MNNYYVHPAAIVESKLIGSGTRIWAFAHVLPGARIGKDCNICDHCFIENLVSIGDRVTVKCGIYIWDGATIGDDVFLGPNVVFTNDARPRSKQYDRPLGKIVIHDGASVGANATLLPDITIGRFAMIGAGSVVTRSVPAHALVYGNPARIKGWVDERGKELKRSAQDRWAAEDGTVYDHTVDGLVKQVVIGNG